MFYEIQADNVYVPSRRPSHLEKRFEGRNRGLVSIEQASANRESFLNARRERISKHWQKIQKAMEEKEEQVQSFSSTMEKNIAQDMSNAEKKRNEIMQRKEQKYANRALRVREKADKARKEKEVQQNLKRKKMEQKLRSSDIRRHVLLKIPRCKLMDENVIEVELIRYRVASKKIQRWWRLKILQRCIQGFKRTGLYGKQVEEAPFERLAPMLQDKRIIAVTSRLLLQAKKLTKEGRARRYKNPTRVFLSSFLIVYHTQEIMQDFGDNEKAVKESAMKMLKHFCDLVDGTLQNISEFIESWNAYHVAFEQWKANDTERILNYMYDHFMQLEQLRESVQSEHPGANAEWHPQIEMQQQLIKDKVVRIGGKSALQKFLSGQKQFRDMSDASDAETMSDSGPKRRPDSVNSTRYAAPESPTVPDAPKSQEDVRLNDVLAEFGGAMTNEQLAHELIMNPDFELTVNSDSIEAQIRTVAKKAFFDKIRQELAAKQFDWVPGIIQDIRNQLLAMLTEKSRVKTEISEILDDELIQQQVKHASIDFQRYISFVVSKMLQLCAPIRDSAIRNIETMEDLVSQIESILTILDDMKLDLANYRLRSLRPHLLKQAAEYERSKFDAALKAGKVSLDNTKLWLEKSSTNMENKVAARNPENVEHPDNRIKYDQVYFDALLGLLFNPEGNSVNGLPETLMMDAERVFSFQNELRALTVVATLVMLTKNFVPDLRDNIAAQQKLKQELLLLLQESNTTAGHLSSHIISKCSKSLKPEQHDLIKAMVEKTLTFKDTVFSLLSRRISQSIKSHLSSGRVRRDSNSGLEIVQTELDQISDKIFLLARHNRDVFAPYYDQILNASTQ